MCDVTYEEGEIEAWQRAKYESRAQLRDGSTRDLFADDKERYTTKTSKLFSEFHLLRA